MQRAKLLVPFDGDGNLRRWTHCRPGQNMASRFQAGETTWREAQDFDATMTIEGMEGNLLILSDERFFRYPMSIRDLGIMLQKASVINGMVDGRWGFVRKGSNYGVVYLGPKSHIQRLREKQASDLSERIDAYLDKVLPPKEVA